MLTVKNHTMSGIEEAVTSERGPALWDVGDITNRSVINQSRA